MSLPAWVTIALILAASLHVLKWLLLTKQPSYVPKHRRPSGDLLLDEANDDERLEGWPGAIYGPDALPWEDAR